MAQEELDDVIASLVDVEDDEPEEAVVDSVPSPSTSEQKVEGPPAELTDRAARQVEKIRKKEGLDESLKLRIAVEGGGCSGLNYKLGFDYQTEDDEVLESKGIEILLDKKHKMYLEGIEIDYPDGLDARGFTFSNPNASETCGCGTSFAV